MLPLFSTSLLLFGFLLVSPVIGTSIDNTLIHDILASDVSYSIQQVGKSMETGESVPVQEPSSQEGSLSRLLEGPNEMITTILSYLGDDKDIASVCLTSKWGYKAMSLAKVQYQPVSLKAMIKGWIQNEDYGQVFVINVDGVYSSNKLNTYEKLRGFNAFQAIEESSVADKILEHILSPLRFKEDLVKKKVVKYIKNFTQEPTYEGLGKYKTQYEDIKNLEDVPPQGWRELYHIVINENQLQNTHLQEILKDNLCHTVVLQLSKENSRFIDTKGVLRLSKENLLESLKNLVIVGHEGIKSIGDSFLQGSFIKKISFRGFSQLESIGFGFLMGCTNLSVLYISGWSNVQWIGDCFLTLCESLICLDIPGWSNTKTIGGHFLGGCTSLKQVNISEWSNVQTIGDCFLITCTSLALLDAFEWSNVQMIGSFFLCGCTSLTHIDLGPKGQASYKVIDSHLPEELKLKVIFKDK